MIQKNKILLLIPKLSNGGIERVASNISIGLEKDIQQSIFSIMNQEQSYEYATIPKVLDVNLGGNFFSKFIVFIRRLFAIYEIKESGVITLSFGERCNILNMLVRKNDIKILSCHSVLSIENKSKGLIGKIYTYLAKKTYNNANYIIAVSSEVKKDLIDNFYINENKIKVINNGYDISNIRNMSRCNNSFVVDDSKLNIITVSRITFAKGIIYQLYILEKLISNNVDCHLYIVGGEERDNYKEKLVEIINNLNLKNNVTFVGYKENVYPYIYKCDVFLLTSIFEGFAGVLIESLACNTPFITSASKGPLDIIKHTDDTMGCHYLNSFSGNNYLTQEDINNIDLFVEIIMCNDFKIKRELIDTAMIFDKDNMCKEYNNLINLELLNK